MIDDVAQEFLEVLNIRIARYYLERKECKGGESSYRLKTNAWAVEHVRDEFLELFGDRVDFEKSLIAAEEEAKIELSQRPKIVGIRIPGEKDYKEPDEAKKTSTKTIDEYLEEIKQENRERRKERRMKQFQKE